MVRPPPSGMASRALIARFRIANSSWPGSAKAGHRSGASAMRISMSSRRVRQSMRCIESIRRLQLICDGCSICRRLNASSRRVSSAPRSPAVAIMSAACFRSGRALRAMLRVSALPTTTVRRLLKSCASPPESWPTASIFWACASCSSVRLRLVRSWIMPTKMEPPSCFASPTDRSMGRSCRPCAGRPPRGRCR